MVTIYVNRNATGDNDGTSWNSAYTDLQSALASATSENQIWLATGTYKPTTSDDRNISFVVPSGVEIYGGFAGGETSLEQRNYLVNETILSGNIGDEDDFADNSYHVAIISNTTADTVIDGLTIASGNASFSASNERGGGIYGEDNSNAILRNLTISNNYAYSQGGGMFIGRNSNTTIDNVVFENNDVRHTANQGGFGGAIYFFNSSNPTITNSLFFYNDAYTGGAIYNDASEDLITELEITNSTFVDNSSQANGAGDSIYLYDSSAEDTETIENSIFWDTTGGTTSEIWHEFDNSFAIINNSLILDGYFVEGESESNISEVPIFVNPGEGDYRLRSNSPGINAGNNEAVDFETDLARNPRIFNDTVDLGAYEYGFLVAISDVSIEESTEEDVNAEFSVTLLDSLGNPVDRSVSVDYTTVDDTAVAGEDFTATSGTLTFDGEEATQTIAVPITNDGEVENAETFFVELRYLSGNAVISDGRAVGTILSSDTPREISIADAVVDEGNEGETAIQFTLLLNESYTEDITVEYTTVEDSATSEDYIEIDGTVTFEAGETEQDISVIVQSDTDFETDETFFIDLNNSSSNAIIQDDRALGTITNDDIQEPIRQITIADAAIAEGNEGEKVIEFGVTLDEASVNNITVDYNLVGNTATLDEDFTNASGTVTFEAGETEQTISVRVLGDTDIEENENFVVQLTNATGNSAIESDRAIGTISNDDTETLTLNTTIHRFQNRDVPGTYLFVGETESENIEENFPDFEYEGIAFKVATEAGDDLIPLYRFQSTRTPGTYLFAAEAERENINENFSDDFNEEGLAFYVYGVGAGKGAEFTRFQNDDRPGTYLFAGLEEAENIRDNFSSFIEEGTAFEVEI